MKAMNPTRLMKVLFVIEQLRAGGKERRLVQLVQELRASHPDVELFLFLEHDEIFYRNILDTGIKISFIRASGKLNLLFQYFRAMRRVAPDIVQCWSVKSAVIFSLLTFCNRFRFVASHIGDTFGNLTWSSRICGRLIDWRAIAVVSNSKAGLAAYRVPASKGKVFYNGFDYKRLDHLTEPVELRGQLSIGTRYVVLMGATVYPAKDYDSFLQTARLLLSRRRDISFLAAGEGILLQHYRELLKPEEREFIRFLGYRNDLDSLINLCDIGLLCSFSEGISNFLLECMVQEKAVVATGAGGTEEIINDGVNGYLLPASAPERVADTIEQLLDNRDIRLRIAANGRCFSRSFLAAAHPGENYYNLYRGIMDR